ncbi:autotransporter assembly complex protein TamA [Aurantiacibacter sediminis]|uniref:BamA/TamA family outer membrane protein n=1 Tax=Aurantiacibacter sediminis TaxID=2793064 RepID=A0ABS0N6A1_9SPHN|nr:BamA/TamA family outer membrane protein [Aurantiacibacter sediminis]MBH5323325.1 BamA/TamA family outer membrane protein [Aurantiacibacter sediminis]
MADPKITLPACRPNINSLEFANSRKRLRWAALAAVCAFAAQPAFAQDAPDNRSLDELIPPEAVENPESWADQGIPQGDTTTPEDEDFRLDSDDPLSEMPLVSIPWPDGSEIPTLDPLEPEEPIEFATFDEEIPPLVAGSEERISDELVLVFPTDNSLFPEREEFLDRFNALSTIEELDDDGNVARLAVQARNDEELLARLLRVYGYFDGTITRSIGRVDDSVDAELEVPAARFDILPGTRYRFGEIDLGNLAEAGDAYPSLRSAFEIQSGDFISLDAIETEQLDLDVALGEQGFPFAAIEEPELLIDHAREEGDLTMPVEPGGQYNFGVVTSTLPDFLSGRHLSRIARWDPGDLYQRSDEEDLRRAILATGLVGSVSLTPVVVEEPANGAPGRVNIEADMTPAPLRTLRGNIGFGTEEGIRLEGSWEHRNLFPPEGLLRVRGIAGTREQLAGVTFQKSNFLGRDRILTIDAFATTIDTDAFDAETVSLVGLYERRSTLLFQKELSWGIGFELVATREAEITSDGQVSGETDFLVAALPGYVQYDTSDDLLDPTEGFRIRGAVSPEISRVFEENSTYLNLQFDLANYQSVSDRVVLAGRLRAGTIVGAPVQNIAPSRRFYAGGGGSVRGYGFNAIGPTNTLGEPSGGRSLVEASLEARVQTPLLDGAVSVVPFVDAGTVSRSSTPDFETIRFGAGLGVRYATTFGPLRLDVAFPLNPGPNDNWVAVYVALGQAF